MRSPVTLAALAATVILAACSETPVTSPVSGGIGQVLKDNVGDGTRIVQMVDMCDPATFNEALGEGTCTNRDRGITFEQFNDQLARLGRVPTWRFTPSTLTVLLGQTYTAVNVGGEAHTFTEVEEFGGGFIEALNNGEEAAPECLGLPGSAFVPPEGTQSDTPEEAGTEKYQCCIHPWMRTTVTVRTTGQ